MAENEALVLGPLSLVLGPWSLVLRGLGEMVLRARAGGVLEPLAPWFGAGPKCPADFLPEHGDHLAMVGAGRDYQASGPGVEPPEDEARQEEALAHRSARGDDGDRAPRNRLANLDLLRPEPAPQDLLLKPRGIVAASLQHAPARAGAPARAPPPWRAVHRGNRRAPPRHSAPGRPGRQFGCGPRSSGPEFRWRVIHEKNS